MSSHDNGSTVRNGSSLPPYVAEEQGSLPPHAAHEGLSGTPAACLVRGRRFILREGQWVDEAVEAMPEAQRIRVRFDSPEFFRLLVKRPELLPNIGSARHVQIALGDTIYEIYD